MAQHGHLSREEKKQIRKERRKLRKDLRQKGIKSRKEFEKIAQMLGLVYGDNGPFLLPWLWKLQEFLAGLGAAKYLLGIAGILGLLFAYAVLANQKGNFIINMSNDLVMLDYELSDTEDFTKPKVRCVSDVLTEVNPFSIEDLPDNLDQLSGSHNIDNVVAYTFWITNNGQSKSNVDWYLLLNKTTKEVDKATWIMVFEDGQISLHASANADGQPERLEGLTANALLHEAAAQGAGVTAEEDGLCSVEAIPYESNHVVASHLDVSLAPGEKHKYTVAIWVDGEDPDCTEDMIGGHAGYQFRFVEHGSTDDIFENIDYSFTREDQDYKDQSLFGAIKRIFKKEK